MLLQHAILMLTIINPTETIIDYEMYEDPTHCEAVADEITAYNRGYNERNAPYGVYCRCVHADNETIDL